MCANKRFFHLCILLLCSFVLACNFANSNVFPGDSWEERSPESQGLDSKKLKLALDYFESQNLEDGNKEVVIIKNGYMIHIGENADKTHNIWSCSKTFTSTVLGLLIDDGVVTLDTRACNFEPALKELYPTVTFRHFATMTSGYSAEGISRWRQENADWSHTPYMPEKPYFKPGLGYAYWDEAQMMFGRVLTRILKQSLQSFLQERVTDKIGMGEWQWHTEKEVDDVPINNGCTNVHVNAKQLARWGWLFLNKGNWNGEQLISEEWVNMASNVQVPNSIPVGDTDRSSVVGPGCYGFNWWVNGVKRDGELKLPGAPRNAFFASGLNNNKCVVIPEWNMVIIRMGQDGHPPDKDNVYGKFISMIGQAFEN